MSTLCDFAPWLCFVSKLLANGCSSKMHHLGQLSSPSLLWHERKSLACKMTPPWDFAPWLYLVFRLLANGCPSQMHHLGQLSSPRLLEQESKSPASKMIHPYDFAPWLWLVFQASIQWISIPNSHTRPSSEFLWLHNEPYSKITYFWRSKSKWMCSDVSA